VPLLQMERLLFRFHPHPLTLLLLLLLALPVFAAAAVIAAATVLDVTDELRTGLAMEDLYLYSTPASYIFLRD
jgi:hypothetical protein